MRFKRKKRKRGNINRIPKNRQIFGIKKALRNRKTPSQFKPGLKKRLRRLGG